MCTEKIKASIVLKKDMIAYKRVAYTHDMKVFKSPTDPGDRGKEPGFKTRGRKLTYEIGKQTTSKAPGIYCYRHPRDIWVGYSYAFIRVRIPKGSRAYLGIDGGRNVILAEHVIPLNIVHVRK